MSLETGPRPTTRETPSRPFGRPELSRSMWTAPALSKACDALLFTSSGDIASVDDGEVDDEDDDL